MEATIRDRKNGRIGELELLRFLFSVMIVYYHLTPILAGIYPEEPLYPLLTQRNGSTGSCVVLAFFVISGVFFRKTLVCGGGDFIAKKFVRLWPVLAFSLLVNFNGPADILNIFFINSGMGVVTAASSNPASWYICVLMWISIIYYFLMKADPNKPKYNAWLLGVSIIMLSLIAHRQTSGLYSALITEHAPFLTNGIALGVAGFSVGILFAQIKPIYIKSKHIVLLFQIITTGACIYLHSFCKDRYTMAFYLLVFLVALYFLLYQEGAKVLKNSRLFQKLGAYSYAIYMMQFPCFHYFKKLIANGTLSWASPKELVVLGVGICVVVGIAVYYAIELPVGALLSKHLKLKNQEKAERNIG